MDDEIPSWLPDLILLEHYKGNWNAYIHDTYQCFHEDFVQSRPLFQKLPISIRHHPAYEEKGATFWHLVSEGNEESERTPDLRRCERIGWPRPIIENAALTDVKVWETTRPWKNQIQRRINLALNNFSYIVVLAENRRGFDLITAFHLDKPRRREKLRMEFENFSGQKKEGSAV